jgi:hypothetical protein
MLYNGTPRKLNSNAKNLRAPGEMHLSDQRLFEFNSKFTCDIYDRKIQFIKSSIVGLQYNWNY